MKECVDSILRQVGTGSEIILVDDGSTDKCPRICDSYSDCNPNVIVVHQKNGGVSSARNTGLEIANGKYIIFVDGDDFVTDDFSKVVQRILTIDSELFVLGYSLVDQSRHEIKHVVWENQTMNVAEAVRNLFDYEHGLALKPAVWNKIFLRDIINDLRFDEKLAISEDLKFLVAYLSKIKSVMLVNEGYYCWRQREDSVTHSGGRVTDIARTVETDLEIRNTLRSFCASEISTFLRWMLHDNIGWYRVGKRVAKTKSEQRCLRKMKRVAMKHSWQIATCKNIRWKERIVYILGRY